MKLQTRFSIEFDPTTSLKNLQFLLKHSFKHLFAEKSGKVFYSSSTLRNLFRLRAKKRLYQSIEHSLWFFCHEIKNPPNLSLLKPLSHHTCALAEKIIQKLENENIPSPYIKKLSTILKNYQRRSLWQVHLLKTLKRCVDKDRFHPLVLACQSSLMQGTIPQKPKSGCSGSYFITSPQGRTLAIFKPCDEEIGACHNPDNRMHKNAFGTYMGTAFSGTGIHREVAAWRVDDFMQLGIVPVTTYAQLHHDLFYEPLEGGFLPNPKTKIGSLQTFCPSLKHILEITPQGLLGINLIDIQKLIILDMIIGNCDRNAANLLTDGKKLVAIDHGLCFSLIHRKYSFSHFNSWSQLHAPFESSLRCLIEALPTESLIHELKKFCRLEIAALDRMQERIAFLKNAVKMDLTVFDTMCLMHPRWLSEVIGRKLTLMSAAEDIVKKYIAMPMHPEKRTTQEIAALKRINKEFKKNANA